MENDILETILCRTAKFLESLLVDAEFLHDFGITHAVDKDVDEQRAVLALRHEQINEEVAPFRSVPVEEQAGITRSEVAFHLDEAVVFQEFLHGVERHLVEPGEDGVLLTVCSESMPIVLPQLLIHDGLHVFDADGINVVGAAKLLEHELADGSDVVAVFAVVKEEEAAEFIVIHKVSLDVSCLIYVTCEFLLLVNF